MGLVWEEVQSVPHAPGDVYPDRLSRAKVPGGWLVFIWSPMNSDQGITFYPDPNHEWEGSSAAHNPVE